MLNEAFAEVVPTGSRCMAAQRHMQQIQLCLGGSVKGDALHFAISQTFNDGQQHECLIPIQLCIICFNMCVFQLRFLSL